MRFVDEVALEQVSLEFLQFSPDYSSIAPYLFIAAH
jgi:hypothetical protein